MFKKLQARWALLLCLALVAETQLEASEQTSALKSLKLPRASQAAVTRMGEMVRRYAAPEMAAVWEEKNKFLNWVHIEEALLSMLAQKGTLSSAEWATLQPALAQLIDHGGIDIERMDAREKVTRHDVNAFIDTLVEQLKEQGAGEAASLVHAGLTSSDVVDTGLSIQLQQASRLILAENARLLERLRELALEHKHTETVARTHGQHAELTSFGLRFLNAYDELRSASARFATSAAALGGKLSGAVGTYSHFSPDEEASILAELGLKPMAIGTQVIARNYHAAWLHDLSLMTGVVSKLAANLRLLAFPELDELTVGFAKGQKGSSAMPHKKNPVLEEQLMGIARALEGFAATAERNIGLEFERDISHSCNERIIFPEASLLALHALKTMRSELERLTINEESLARRLASLQDLPFSGHYLIALLELGIDRETAYRAVQEASFRFIEQDRSDSAKVVTIKDILGERSDFGAAFLERLDKDCGEGLRLGTSAYQFRHIEAVYERVFAADQPPLV